MASPSWAALAAVVVLLGAAKAEANGGTLRLARAPAGPYLVSVWTQPDPPRVGQLDVSVAVMAPATGEAILDARPAIRADTAALSVPAKPLERGGGGNRLLYHALVETPAAGRWVMAISVAGPLGIGETSFEVDVRRAFPLTWLLGAGGAVLTMAALAWQRLLRRQRRTGVAAVVALALTGGSSRHPTPRRSTAHAIARSRSRRSSATILPNPGWWLFERFRSGRPGCTQPCSAL